MEGQIDVMAAAHTPVYSSLREDWFVPFEVGEWHSMKLNPKEQNEMPVLNIYDKTYNHRKDAWKAAG